MIIKNNYMKNILFIVRKKKYARGWYKQEKWCNLDYYYEQNTEHSLTFLLDICLIIFLHFFLVNMKNYF